MEQNTRDAILAVDDAIEGLKEKFNARVGDIEDRWVLFFDMALAELIKTRLTLHKAMPGKPAVDWEFVYDAIKKDAPYC